MGLFYFHCIDLEDRQLIFADASQKIWFIGDSKYYKEKNDIVGESVYKQFTYARNIIQYNINDLLKGDGQNGEGVLRYRDPLTEGYSVTPNFFIRGEVDKGNPCEIPATGDAIKKDGADMWAERNRHFENRLFDRDTLLLQVYDVNFLYVLKAFTAKPLACEKNSSAPPAKSSGRISWQCSEVIISSGMSILKIPRRIL